MNIRTGILIPGSETPIGEGVTAPVRAHLILDGRTETCVLKRLPQEGVLAEAFCALLFRAWGLPVPEPVLVELDTGLAFASLDAGYPNLKQRIGWRTDLPEADQARMIRIGAAIVCNWSDAGLALAADEAIANSDRNLGNFLWDGLNHAYIDHERALGHAPHERNLIAEFAKLIGQAETIEASAVAAALTLSPEPPINLECIGAFDTSGYAGLVSSRLTALAASVLRRFPKPQDLLANLDP